MILRGVFCWSEEDITFLGNSAVVWWNAILVLTCMLCKKQFFFLAKRLARISTGPDLTQKYFRRKQASFYRVKWLDLHPFRLDARLLYWFSRDMHAICPPKLGLNIHLLSLILRRHHYQIGAQVQLRKLGNPDQLNQSCDGQLRSQATLRSNFYWQGFREVDRRLNEIRFNHEKFFFQIE